MYSPIRAARAESGQYPYPVYYELVEKDDLLEKTYQTLNDTVQIAGNLLEETHDAKAFLAIMNHGVNRILLSLALNMQEFKKEKFKDEKEEDMKAESEIEMNRLLIDTVLADAVKLFAKMFLVKSFGIFSPEEMKALSEEKDRK
jgi:L-lactate utilization protein LutC